MYQLFYVKSNYSLLSSLLTIDDIISYHKENHFSYVAICDDNMYGTMEFIKKAQAAGLFPIIGLEIYLDQYSLLAYVKNYAGYQHLIKLSTLQNSHELVLDDIIKYQEDLFFIVPYNYCCHYENLKSVLKNLYIGYANQKEEQKVLSITSDIVFLPKCLYMEATDEKYLAYLFMIRDGKTIQDDICYELSNLHMNLGDILELSHEEGLKNTMLLAKSCQLVFPDFPLLLPIYECPNGIDADSYLSQLAKVGLSRRLSNQVPLSYFSRLKYELSIIHKMGFSNYFLVVYDFIKYAKKNGILVGPGRGSAAGSLVAYCLGITDIDPIFYDLLFERFLNPERVSMPDIDTDIPDVARDTVIDYVRKKYGHKRVAGIVTFATLAPKQVIRDVGRILAIPNYKIDKLSSFLPAMSKEALSSFFDSNIEFKNYILSDNALRELYQIAIKFEGFPRQIGTHAAGIVMCQKDLDDLLPLTVSDEMYLTSYSMNYLEELGLLKMDFLGIKNLTMIMNILDDIKKNYGKDVSFSEIPLDDQNVFSLFSNAFTTGIFQFESSGMRNFLRQLKPQNFEDIVAAIALFRPGPASNIGTYIARKEKREEVKYLDPCLSDILERTYGIMIYQEQIMQVVNVYADYSLGEADILRRAISKKKVDVLKQEEKNFLEKAKKLGRDENVSKELFSLILKFAGYGFNRSHAVAYSLVAYKMAYLKVHYKNEFYANMLSNVIGMETKTKEYLSEVRSCKIKLLKPDINMSIDRFLVLGEDIIFPFSSIKGIGVSVCKTILEAKSDGVFLDLFDAFSRLAIHKITKHQLEILILADCFRSFSYNKKTLMNNLDALMNYAELTKDIDQEFVLKPEIITYEEYESSVLLEQEKLSFGFYISNHPVTMYHKNYPNAISLEEVQNYYNKNVQVLMMVEKIKVIQTKKGDTMAFVSGSDDRLMLDFTLFPKVYERYSNIEKGMICLVKGIVEKRLNQTQIIVNQLEYMKEDKDEEKDDFIK